MPSRVLLRCARLASRALLGLSLLVVLGGSSCWVRSADDDDDHYCDDDDSGIDDDDDGCPDDDDGDDDDFFAPAGGAGGGAGGGLISADQVSDQLDALERPQLAADDAGPGSLSDRGPQEPDLPQEAYRLEQYRLVAGDLPGLHPLRSIADIGGLTLFDLWGPGEYGPDHLARFAQRVLEANRDLVGPEVGALHFDQVLYTQDLSAVRYVQTLDARDLPGQALPDAEVLVVFDLLGRLIQIENTTWVPRRSAVDR